MLSKYNECSNNCTYNNLIISLLYQKIL